MGWILYPPWNFHYKMKVGTLPKIPFFNALNSEAAWLTANDPPVVFLSMASSGGPLIFCKIPRSGVALIENTMYQPIPTSEYLDGMPNEESLVQQGVGCVCCDWYMVNGFATFAKEGNQFLLKSESASLQKNGKFMKETDLWYLSWRSAEASWSSSTKQRRFRVFKDWASFIIPRVWDRKVQRPKCKNVISLRILTTHNKKTPF